ncbi:MAG: hypothetical protein AB7F75_05115 [Planctomycetota bacterium]
MKSTLFLFVLSSLLSLTLCAAVALFEDGTLIEFQSSVNKESLVVLGDPANEEKFVVDYIRKPGSEVLEDRPLHFSKAPKDAKGREFRIFNSSMLKAVAEALSKNPDATFNASISIHTYKGENVAVLRKYQIKHSHGGQCGGSDKATIMKFEAVFQDGKFQIMDGEFKGQTLEAVPNKHLEAIEGKWDAGKNRSIIFKAQVISNDHEGKNERFLLIEKGYTLTSLPNN